MDALVHAVCPSCQASGDVPSKFVGANIRCRKCGTNFQVKPPPSLDDLDALDDIHLMPQTEEELEHESRVQAKSAKLMKDWK